MRQRRKPDPERKPTEFGRFVDTRMRECGYGTQEDLARAVGVSQATVSRWIYEDRRLTMDSLTRLARALRMDAAELVTVAAGAVDQAEPEQEFDDPEEQAIWGLDALPAARRIYLIEMLRAQKRTEEQTRNMAG